MRRSLDGWCRSLWPGSSRRWRARRRRATSLPARGIGVEALETRLVLTGPGADPLDAVRLDAGQVTALVQGFEVLAHQLAAVQVTGTLGAPTAGLHDPLGLLVPVGPVLADRLAAPLAERLGAATDVAGIRAAIAAVAALDDATGDAMSIPVLAVRESGNTLWFELSVRWQRDLPRYQLDLDQHPAAAGAAPTLLDRGLRLGTIETTVRAAFEGLVALGIDRTQGQSGLQAIQARIEPIRVSASASAVAEDVEAVLGAFRLGAEGADVALDVDVAATVGLAGGPGAIPVGRLVSGAPADQFVIQPAAGARFDVSIPWRLAVGGFAESGSDVVIRVGAADPFAGPGSLQPAAIPLAPSGTAAAAGSVDLVGTFGRTLGSDFGAAVVAGARLVPGFLADQPLPVVGRPVGEVFELAAAIDRVVAPLSGAGGAPTFTTLDDLEGVLGKDLAPRWNAARSAFEITLPVTLDETASVPFAPESLVPASLSGRLDAATGDRLGGLSLVGAATAVVGLVAEIAMPIDVGLAPAEGEDRIGERIALPAGRVGEATISLDATFRGGGALGPAEFAVGEGQARIVGGARLDIVTTDVGAPDGRSTIADIAGAAGRVSTTSIVTSSLDGVVTLDAGDGAAALGIGGVAALTVTGAGVGASVGPPTSNATPSKPFVFLDVAGNATWSGMTIAANDRLAALGSALSELSFADVPAIIRLVGDWLARAGLDDVRLPLLAGSLADALGISAAAERTDAADLLALLGDPAAETPHGTAFDLGTRGTFGIVDLDLVPLFDEAMREVRQTVPEGVLSSHAAAFDAVQRLVWDSSALARDWQARAAGPEGFGDFDGDFVRRLRAWGAALAELTPLLPGPAAHPDFDWSPNRLPHYGPMIDVLGAIVTGIDSLGLGIEDLAARFGAALPGIDVSFALPEAGSGRTLDLVLDCSQLRVGLQTAPTTVEGFPLVVTPDPAMRLSLGGTITARIGLDADTGQPTLLDDESAIHLTAGFDLGGARSAGATIGGLSGLRLGTDAAPLSLSLTDSSALSGHPARYDLDPGSTLRADARFSASLPLAHPDRVHLGRLSATGLSPSTPAGDFPVTFAYVPEINPTTKQPWFASVRAILEAPGLPVNLGAWTSGVAGFVDTVTEGLAADLLGKLPLLGGVDVASIGFFARLDGLFQGIDVTSPATMRAGLAALGGATAGLRIVSAGGQDRSAAVDTWAKLAGDDRVVVDLALSESDVTRIDAGAFEFGLDALGLEVRGAGKLLLATDFTLRVGLGYSRIDGFFVESGAGEEIHAGIGLGFDSAAGSPPLELRLGSLYFDLEDGTPGPISWDATATPEMIAAARAARELDADVGLDLGAGRTGVAAIAGLLPAATIRGSAKANLDLAIGADLFGISRVTAHVRAGWSEAGGAPVEFDRRLDGVDLVGAFHFDGITDVRLGLDGLLGEDSVVSRLLGKFESILDPLDPILGVLREEVPVISDLSKKADLGAVTYLDAIRASGTLPPQAQEFLDLLDRIDTWTTVVRAIADGIEFDLGSLDLGSGSSAAALLGSVPADAGSFSLVDWHLPEIPGLAALRDDFGIGFPLLDRPQDQVFNLLFGRDVDLVTWDLPDLDVGFGVDEYFTIFGPLVGHLYGNVSIVTDFLLGYDTRGIRAAFGGSSVRPAKVFDGLYFDDHVSGGVDAPEATFEAAIGGGLGLGLPGFAVGGIDGGFDGYLSADLHDNDADGKVYLDEFIANFLRSPECVFDLAGALEASLEAYLKVGFDGPWGWVSLYHKTYEIASATLADFDSISCPPARPVLAEVITVDASRAIEGIDLPYAKGTKVLALNAGPRAGRVVPGTTTDGDEEWTVSPRDGGGLIVAAWGHTQEFTPADLVGVSRIVFDAGAGNDTVEAADGVALPFEGFGGPGNDRLTGSTGANRLWGDGGRVTGAAGNDVIKGRRGADRLFGGPGNDFVWGYGGIDSINGGDGDDALYGEDESGDMASFIAANDGWGAGAAAGDTIDAGSGVDTVSGGDGDDTLSGGEGDDFVTGGHGNDRMWGGAGNDQLLGGDGDDTIHGDGSDDLDPTVSGDDLVEGGGGADVIHGGPGDDTLWAWSEAEGLAAAAGPATIALDGTRNPAGGFVSWVSGDDGRDTIHGTAGRDFLSGGFDSDAVRGGTGGDEMLGGPGSDLLVATGGAARIFGGHGNDVIDGGPGDNWIEGGPGDDDIYAREGSDTVFGGVTAIGDALLLVDEASGRQIVSAIHGGFTSRLRTGPGTAPCEPEVFYHPEVYPDAPGSIVVTIYEDLDADGTMDPGEGPPHPDGAFGLVLGNRSDRTQPALSATTNGGEVRLPEREGLVAGDYLLSLRALPKGGWTPSPGTLTSVAVTLDAAHPTFALAMGFYRPGRLAGRVADAANGPAAGIPVYLDLDGGDDYDVDEPVAFTDARGAYVFEGLLPGAYSVRVASLPVCASLAPEQHDVTLASGGALADLDFRFTANAFPVVKRVLLGEGAVQALLRWTPVPDGAEQLDPLAPASAFGRIAFEVCAGVPLGKIGAGATLFSVGADGSTGAEIQLNWIGTPSLPNRLEYSFVKPLGQTTLPTGHYRVVLDDASVTTAGGGLLDGDWKNPSPATPGGDRYASGNGSAGGDFVFDFVVGPAGGAIAQAALATRLEGTVWHDLGIGGDPALAPGLAGRSIEVTDASGAVVATTRSGPIDLDGDGAVTGAERGAWRIDGLPEGRYSVRLAGETGWGTSQATVAGGPPGLWALGTSRASGKAVLSSLDPAAPSAVLALEFAGIAVRDIAVTGGGIAWVTGTALDGTRGLPAGTAGLWRLTIGDGAIESFGAVPGNSPIVSLDAVDDGTLLGIRADGGLVRFLTGPRVWTELGGLLDATGAKWFPVGDLAVVGPREVYAVAIAGGVVDLSKASPGGQTLVRIDPGLVGVNTTTVRRLVDDKVGTLLVGLERVAGATLLALGLDETLFEIPLAAAAAVVARGRVVGLADLISGGLAAGVAGAVPVDPHGPGANVDLHGGWTVDVGFGSGLEGRTREDGDDFIDGGCGPEADFLHGDNGDDLPADVTPLGGDDWLRGRQGDDVISGGQGSDTLLGNDGTDTLVAGTGVFNWIDGGMGADKILGSAGTDVALGGAGKDAISGGDGPDVLLGGADDDTLLGEGGADLLAGGTGADRVSGGLGDDVLVVIDRSLGGEFDLVPTGAWSDALDGNAGTDTLFFNADASARLTDATLSVWVPDKLGGVATSWGEHAVAAVERASFTGGESANVFDAAGFSGAVTLVGAGGADTLSGGRAADWIVGNAGDDTIEGNGGADTVLPGTGTNRLVGGPGDDLYQVITGGINTIVEAAGGGSDTLDASRIGFAQNLRVGEALVGTTLSAGAGTSTTFGNAVVESVRLGAGSDTVVLRDGASSAAAIDAGGGQNTLSYADPTGAWTAWAGAVVVDLAAGTATGLRGIGGFTVVVGGKGGDTLSGAATDDRIDGGAGADVIDGRGGNDTLDGGLGNDRVTGGAGNDRISGISGADTLAGGADDDVYTIGDAGFTGTVSEAPGAGNDQLLLTSAAGVLFSFTADGRLVATYGPNSLTVAVTDGIERIRGGSGADVFRIASGAAFAGILEGGGFPAGSRTSFDTLDYSAWNAAVTVDMSRAALVAAVPASGTGGVIDVRHVIGGTVDDRLTGGAVGVWFEGRAGGDTLVGSTADDLLDGGNGVDTIEGRDGADTILGGWGSDTLAGGKGDDDYVFADLFANDTVTENVDEGFDRMDFSATTLPLEVRLGSVVATAGGASVTHAGTSVEQVVGGSADDRFLLTGPQVTFPGILDGGGGTNTLVWQQATVAIDRAVAAGRTPNVGSAVNFARTVVELAMAPVVRDGIDLDGNGTADTIWVLANGLHQGWLTDAAGNVVARRALGGDATWSLATAGDFDGDGVTDLAWRHSGTGAVVLWLMRGNGVMASNRVIGGDLSWSIEASGDYDGDGRDDLVWRHGPSGIDSMWLMNGLGVKSTAAIGGDPSTRLVSTGPGYDADGDGRTDLLWRTATGTTVLALMNGTKTVSTAVLAIDPTWSVVATGDFNGDRRHDLALSRPDATVMVRLMDGSTVLSSAVIGGDSRTAIVGTVDRPRDGRTDLAWRDLAGAVTVWEMNGTAVTRRSALGGDVQTVFWRRPGRRVV